MTFLQLGDAWINPEAVVSVLPDGHGGCVVHMLAGPDIGVQNASADAVAQRLVEAVNP